MPKIKTNNGVIKYKTEPLFPGVKIINKEIAGRNLNILKDVLYSNNIKFILAFGTLLGAVREKDFITHDEDVDLIVFDRDKQKIFDLIPAIMKVGFRIVRYDRRNLLSIMKDGEYIDFYFFKEYKDNLYKCSGILHPNEFLENLTTLEFKGVEYFVPQDSEGFLRFLYGDDWRVPIQWNNYEMKKFKRFFFVFKEKIKDILPDFIFFPLAQKAENRLELYFQKRVESYREKIKNEKSLR